MRRRFSRLPSPSLVVALIALFVALGGTALAKVLITGSNIKNGSITGTQIKKGSLTGNQIKRGSISGTQIKGNSLGGGQINESSLGTVPNANAVGGKGASSFQAADHWALIQATVTGANVLAQSGGMSVTRSSAGHYLVSDGGSVVSKPLSATFGTLGFGFITAAPCGGSANNPGGVNCPVFNDNNHVLVETLNTAAAAFIDSTFYVTIGG
jgi:hypothetical protein